MDPVIVKLKHPITFGSKTIEELSFRRGRLSDLKGVKISDFMTVDEAMLVAGRMCGHPTAVLGQLDAEDAGEVLVIAADFFAKCLTTGESPSPS